MWRRRLARLWRWLSDIDTAISLATRAVFLAGPVGAALIAALSTDRIVIALAAGVAVLAAEVLLLLVLVVAKEEPEQESDVVIHSPRNGERVRSSFVIRGTAITFENNVVVLRYVDGEWVLAGGPVTAAGEVLGEPADFSIEMELPPGRHYLHVGDQPPVDEIPFRGAELVVDVE